MDDNISVLYFQKRKGPDLILKMLDRLSFLLWGFTIIIFGVILSAKPQWETFFDRLFNVSVRDYWDYKLLRFAFIISIVQFVISLFSLFLNSKRLKRKEDKIRNSIIISLFASLMICIILMLIVW